MRTCLLGAEVLGGALTSSGAADVSFVFPPVQLYLYLVCVCTCLCVYMCVHVCACVCACVLCVHTQHTYAQNFVMRLSLVGKSLQITYITRSKNVTVVHVHLKGLPGLACRRTRTTPGSSVVLQ